MESRSPFSEEILNIRFFEFETEMRFYADAFISLREDHEMPQTYEKLFDKIQEFQEEDLPDLSFAERYNRTDLDQVFGKMVKLQRSKPEQWSEEWQRIEEMLSEPQRNSLEELKDELDL